MKHLCVYCGASAAGLVFREAARDLARGLVSSGWALVYGGASVGLMGVVADEVLAAGGSVVGVIPRSLQDREIAHRGLSELHVTEDMHERKALMVSLSDAFVALPGGWGTLDELCEIITWRQLSLHHKPCGILNTAGFYDAFFRHLDRMDADGFSRFNYRTELVVTDSTVEMLRQLTQSGQPG